MPSSAIENSPDLWRDQFPFPQKDDNKYTRGHALICGGALMTGATRLSARAAQRMGAGLVTSGRAAAIRLADLCRESLESVIVRPADTVQAWRDLLNDPKKTALLIGPGLGIGTLQTEFVLAALETRKPCVLDADALTNFAENADALFSRLHKDCILTPHEGEFTRLFGKSDADKQTRAVDAPKKAGCVVLLKGAETFIASPEGDVIVNRNAPPTLATGGSGDVLAGMILGLMAQNMPVYMAGAAASWLHGAIAAGFGPGLIAEDIVAGIPAVLGRGFVPGLNP